MWLCFAFILLLSASLSGATEFGFVSQLPGNGASSVAGIAQDREGNYFIAGRTRSNDLAATGFQTTMGGSNLVRLGGGGYSTLRTPRPGTSDCVVAGWRNPGLVFVSSYSRIYKSSDGGTTWSESGTGLPGGGSCSSISMDAAESGLVYVSYRDGGVYRSTDGGSRWAATGTAGMGAVRKVLVDPWDSSHVVVLDNQSVWYSTDGGSDWQPVPVNLFTAAFDPGRRGIVFGSHVGDAVVYRSGDGGKSWVPAGTLPTSSRTVFAVAVDPNQAGTVYVTDDSADLFRSRDDGQTWESVAGVSGVFQLAIDPRTSALYVNDGYGEGVSRSEDGGTTWTRLGAIPNGGTLQMALAPDTTNPASAPVVYLGRNENIDAYIAKYSPAGALLWVSYLGGAGNEEATALCVDGEGSVYVAGTTNSAQFPFAGGSQHVPDPAASGGGFFIAKVSSDGRRLIYSAILRQALGGPGTIGGIAVDARGAAHAGGWDTVGSVPLIGVPILDSFTVKLSPDGAAFEWRSDLGGDGKANALALDAAENTWVSTGTALWKIDPQGGSGVILRRRDVTINALNIDRDGQPLMAGLGYTGYGELPLPSNAFQRSVPGYNPPPANYVAVIDPSSGNVISSTLLAGESTDTAAAIGVDSQGRILVGGATQSGSLPTRRPVQGPFHASTGFLTRFNARLTDIDVSTFAGDRRRFSVTGLTVDDEDNIVFVGNTLDQNSGEATAAFLAQLKIDAPAGDLRLDAVLNAASRLASPVAPGEMVALPGDSFREDAQVFFDDAPAQIVFRNWKEIRVVAPASLAGRTETRVHVEAGGQVSGSILMPVAAASPGIFTAGGSGWTFALAWDASGAPVLPESPVKVGAQVVVAVNGVPPGTAATVTTQSGNPVTVVGAEWGTRPDLPGALLLRLALDDSIGPLPPFLSVSAPGAPPSRFVPLAVVP